MKKYLNIIAKKRYDMKKIKIAIIDTGIKYDNVFLKGKIKFNQSLQFSNKYKKIEDIYDINGHGTLCALTINSICSNIEIYPIKLFNDEGRGSSLNLLNVLKKLLYSDIKVINIAASFSSGLYDEDISKVCESLKNKGKILVASNYNTDKRISYLASMKSVIGVGNLENAYFDHQFIFNRSNDIQLKGNNRVCFYCIDDQVELFGKNSRLSCVTSAFISNILLDKGDLAFEEIEDSLENISKINEKKTFCHESEYKTEYKEYYDELLEMINSKYIINKSRPISLKTLLKLGIINPYISINKYNIDSFIKSINNRFNVCISLNGLFLHQVTAINSLIEIIIKYRKEIRYA